MKGYRDWDIDQPEPRYATCSYCGKSRGNAMLTRYGPGKFSLLVDVVAFQASLDGCEGECGDADTVGHCALVTGGEFLAEVTPSEVAIGDLSAEDVAFLKAQTAALVYTDSQGFVTVDWFTDEAKARAVFASREASMDEDDEGDYCPTCGNPTDEGEHATCRKDD